MKRFIPILFIFFLSVSNLLAQDNKVQFYGTAGISSFSVDDIDTLGYDKQDLHIGLGLQITDLIGMEFALHRAPAFDRQDFLIKELEKERGSIYSIRANYKYSYSSLWGTLTKRLEHDFSIVNDFSIVVKGGVASYKARRVIPLKGNVADISSIITDDGLDMVFSIGTLYHYREKQDFEFSITKVLGDAGYLSFNIYWKYKFFKL